MLLQDFVKWRKLSPAAEKAPRGRILPAGRMLWRPPINAHKPKSSKTRNGMTAGQF